MIDKYLLSIGVSENNIETTKQGFVILGGVLLLVIGVGLLFFSNYSSELNNLGDPNLIPKRIY
jgi:hypothetical protein